MNFRIHAQTHPGLRRKKNEDTFCIEKFKNRAEATAMLMVADGMGGHSAGHIAARLAAESFQTLAQDLPTTPDIKTLDNALIHTIARANAAIAAHVKEHIHTHGMGATVVSAFLTPGHLRTAWLGDSRAYRVHKKHAELVTRDHSFVNNLVDRGIIRAVMARHHPDRHIVTRALGVGGPSTAGKAATRLAPGDIVILCSDGLSDMITDKTISQIACSADNPEICCQQLVDAANERGGTDNITVAVAFCDA